MTVTIAPSTEACQALVDRINTGTYAIGAVDVSYGELLTDMLESMKYVRVDVLTIDEEQLNETLGDDRTSHNLKLVIRAKLKSDSQQQIDDLKLFVRELYERVNDWDSADGRVRVWECDLDTKANPDKDSLNNAGVFKTSVDMRVEVEA